MAKTFLDELVEYPARVIQKLGTTPDIVSLLTDNTLIDMDSDEADEVFDKYLFDYGYVDTTSSEARAYICVEAELIRASTPTINDFYLYVTVICHKGFMSLDNTRFVGILGNRRDNLVREIDKVLNGAEAFGIGALTLKSVKTVSSPVGFTARELTYFVSDFRNRDLTR